jgi:hypothetical protein
MKGEDFEEISFYNITFSLSILSFVSIITFILYENVRSCTRYKIQKGRVFPKENKGVNRNNRAKKTK